MYSNNGFILNFPSDKTLASDSGQERQRTRESLFVLDHNLRKREYSVSKVCVPLLEMIILFT